MTMNRQDSTLRPVSEAARWFAKVNGGTLDDAEMAAFEAWLADPQNRADYADCARIWSTAEVPEFWAFDAALAEPPASHRPAHRTRRWVIGGLAIAASVLLMLGVASRLDLPQETGEQYRTAVGEQRLVVLADNSSIHLNTATALKVHYSARRRHIEMVSGEAFFDVAPDPDRPFEVETPAGIVRAVGTEFMVRAMDGGRVILAVAEGKVEVVGAMAAASGAAPLAVAGEELGLDARGATFRKTAVDPAKIGEWRKGVVSFSDIPLAEVIREINRYTNRPIRLQNAGLGDLRVSAVFHIGEVEAFLEGLAEVFPIAVEATGDGPVLIRRS